MTDSHRQSLVTGDDEIDLRELFRVLWNGKWLIGGITFAVAVIAVIVTLMMPNIYRAEALLAPNDQGGAGGLSALATEYGGLARLAGIDIGDRSVDQTDLALEILKSRKFLAEFVDRHDILVELMAVNGWNADTGKSKVDSDIYDVDADKWVRKARPPRTTMPSPQEAHEQFLRRLSVSKNAKSGFISLAIEHYSPITARNWVDWLVKDLNSSIMERDVTEAEQAIQYLNEQVSNTSLAGLQSVFFNLIEEQTKRVMLARMTDEYSFKTLDPAVVPEEKFRPRRALIVIITGLFGFFSAILIRLISVYLSGSVVRAVKE